MPLTLPDLGWSAFFAQAPEAQRADLEPARVSAVHRDRLSALSVQGEITLRPDGPAGAFAVGDWVMTDGSRVVATLARRTCLSRRAAGTDARIQVLAANVDTLFVVTSCNSDFNVARLERYLVLAREAGCFPVVVVTRADLAEAPRDWERRAEALARGQIALAVDARDPGDAARLMDWVGLGHTAALVGSSGAGKTTLANAMTGSDGATQGIREDDAKGRHTTTRRDLRPMKNGGWLIDTPGMRALRLTETAGGIDRLFEDVIDLAAACRFRDCAHDGEPGCAVQAAVDAGELDPGRLRRWRKLRAEDARNSETLAASRARDRSFGRRVRVVMREKDRRAGR